MTRRLFDSFPILSILLSNWLLDSDSHASILHSVCAERVSIVQILPLFGKYEVVHFNKTDARLANNGLPIELQRLRCRVNYQALRFTDQIESLGNKLVQILQAKGYFVALHLRYEMDMLAFSGCTHGCSVEEAEMLKRMRFVLLGPSPNCENTLWA